MKVKYIKSHAQRLVSELTSKWSDEVALELAETLTDYAEVLTGGKEPEEKVEPAAKPAKEKKLPVLRECYTNSAYEKIFKMAEDASRANSNRIFVTAANIAVTPKRLYTLIANINASNYMKVHHPNCHVSYRRHSNGFELLFTRKDAEA